MNVDEHYRETEEVRDRMHQVAQLVLELQREDQITVMARLGFVPRPSSGESCRTLGEWVALSMESLRARTEGQR